MKKLTRAQQEVVELLKSNPYNIKNIGGFYAVCKPVTSTYTRGLVRWVQARTFNTLLRLNIIKTTDQKDIYVLSEKE